jgi:hypothetical protein
MQWQYCFSVLSALVGFTDMIDIFKGIEILLYHLSPYISNSVATTATTSPIPIAIMVPLLRSV